MAKLGTVITAMVTPFDGDLKLDLTKAEHLADYLINNGSDGLVVAGTTGESPTLSKQEKEALYKTIASVAKGKATVIAGTGSNSTSESIELTSLAEKAGVDAAMLVVPYYNKPPQAGLYKHFSLVARSTDLPIVLYNVPSRTACNLEASTVIQLAQDHENIRSLKEAGSDVAQISRITSETPDDFEIYCGQDDWNLMMLSLGCCGFISVASHVAGSEIKEMAEAYLAGDVKKAVKMHNRLMPVYKVLFETTNPIMVKAAMNHLGIDVGAPRLPLIEANDDQMRNLKAVIGNVLVR